jgi:outer membrane cobalamin receptor
MFAMLLFFAILAGSGRCEDSPASSCSSSTASAGDRIVLNSAQIKDMNVQSIPELLNRLPGITAGETYAKIQGATNVRALLDGRPMSDASSGHGGIKWNMISIQDIEKIEILMGGGAAAVGDGTSGGAIIITSRKNDAAHGHVDLAAGNYGTEDLSFRFGQTVKALSMGATGSYGHTDGNRINNDKTLKRAGARLDLNGEKRGAGVSVEYATDNRGYPGKPQWPTPLAREFSEHIGGALSGKIGSANANIYYAKDFKETDDPQQPVATQFDGWSAGAKAGKTFVLGILGPLSTGIEGCYEKAAGFRKAKGSTSVLEKWGYSEEEWNAGVWATKTISIPVKPAPLSLVAGLRVNYYSAFSANVNPELRLRFSPGLLSFNAGVAIMHNTPNLSKRYYQSSTTIQNPDIMPERGTNTACGIGYSGTVSLPLTTLGISCNAQGFYNLIDDRITYISLSSSSQGQYSNLGHVVRRGVDFSLGVKLDSLFTFCDLSVDASLGLLDARDLDTDLFLTASPKHNAKIAFCIKLFKIVSLRLIGEYYGEQYTTSDNLSTSAAHFLLNGSADIVVKRMTIYLKSENVLDAEYTCSDGYPGAPREYAGGVRCEF